MNKPGESHTWGSRSRSRSRSRSWSRSRSRSWSRSRSRSRGGAQYASGVKAQTDIGPVTVNFQRRSFSAHTVD